MDKHLYTHLSDSVERAKRQGRATAEISFAELDDTLKLLEAWARHEGAEFEATHRPFEPWYCVASESPWLPSWEIILEIMDR